MVQRKRPRVVVPPKFEDVKSPNYMYVYATGVFGGLDPNGGRMIFFLDRIEPETVNEPTPGAQKVKKVVRELQVEVHVSPTQFKSIALWMNRHVKQYEELFGPIPMEPKRKPPPSGLIT
jgi:hypothetical protein